MPRRRPDLLLARIDALRARGVTWAELAEAIGSHTPTVIAWASRRRASPQRPSIAERLLEVLPELERGESNPDAAA